MSLLRRRLARLTPVHFGTLLLAALLFALVAVPATASAATTLSIEPGHAGGDYDNENDHGRYVEGQDIEYNVRLTNTNDDDASAVVLRVTLPEELSVDPTTVTGAVCTGGAPALECTVASIVAGGHADVTFDAVIGAAEYTKADSDYFDEVETTFELQLPIGDDGEGVSYATETTSIVDADPTCTWSDNKALTLTEVRAGAKGTATLACVSPAGDPLAYEVKPGLDEGQAAHTGAISPTTSTTDPTFTWTPNSDVVAQGASFGDYFVVLVSTTGGVIEQYISFDVFATADLGVTVSAPAALPVPTTGATTTYTATVTNKGPDTATGVPVALFVSANTTLVSSAVNGAVATCETMTWFVDLGPLAYGCAVPTIAPGASATVAVTVRFTPGVAGVTVPGSATVFGLSGLFQMTPPYLDQNFDDNRSATSTIALTVPSVVIAPTPKVDPNKPTKGNDKIVGTKGSDRINGGAGNDIINGGFGRDFLFGGAGNDRLLGGAGNDSLDGGSGNDKLGGGAGNDQVIPGAGKDTVNAGSGNDTINGKDGAVDKITCGPGRDVVTADKGDKVAKDCEVVKRR